MGKAKGNKLCGRNPITENRLVNFGLHNATPARYTIRASRRLVRYTRPSVY